MKEGLKLHDVMLKNKEDVLERANTIKSKLFEKMKDDINHKEGFADEFIKVIDKFLERLKNEIIIPLPDMWGYSIEVEENGIALNIIHFVDDNIDFIAYDKKTLVFKVWCDMIELSKYVKENNEGLSTINQKIRRGDITSAIKVSNQWLIPSFSKYIKTNKKANRYSWDDAFFTKEFEYLNKYKEVEIKKSEKEKNKFDIKFIYKVPVDKDKYTFSKEDIEKLNNGESVAKWSDEKEYEIKILDINEKEKLEGMLIANQFVKCESNVLLSIYY